MSELPSTWKEVKLGEIAETRLGKMLSTKAKTGVNARPYLRNKNVQWGHFDLSDVWEMDFSADEFERFSVASGDLLVCEGGEVGRSAIWRGQIPAVAYQKALHRIRPSAGISPEFVLYLMMWLAQTDALAPFVTGSTIKHLPQEGLRELPVPLPPVHEQHRMVATIEEQFSRLDVANVALMRTQSRLASLRTGILVGKLKGMPSRQLGTMSSVHVGTTPSRRSPEMWNGDIPWVSSGEVAFCRIRETRETISPKAASSPGRIHPPGTVLLAMIGEGKTRGQAAILDVPAAHNQNSAAIRLDARLCTPEWLFYVLMAQYEETRKAGVGGQQPALNRARVTALKIPLPPVAEQRQAVVELDQQLSILDAMKRAIVSAERQCALLRRAILERAFRGQLT